MRRTPPPTFRPTTLLLLAWFLVFFFAFSLALVVPAMIPLWPVLTSPLPDETLTRIATQAARDTIQPRLGLAAGLALVTTAAAIWLRLLPGVRRNG